VDGVSSEDDELRQSLDRLIRLERAQQVLDAIRHLIDVLEAQGVIAARSDEL
jgi:hypothetical protein